MSNPANSFEPSADEPTTLVEVELEELDSQVIFIRGFPDKPYNGDPPRRKTAREILDEKLRIARTLVPAAKPKGGSDKQGSGIGHALAATTSGENEQQVGDTRAIDGSSSTAYASPPTSPSARLRAGKRRPSLLSHVTTLDE